MKRPKSSLRRTTRQFLPVDFMFKDFMRKISGWHHPARYFFFRLHRDSYSYATMGTFTQSQKKEDVSYQHPINGTFSQLMNFNILKQQRIYIFRSGKTGDT
jgi:hypothetical protein